MNLNTPNFPTTRCRVAGLTSARRTGLLAAGLFSAALACAQTAPATGVTPRPKEEVLELSPFVVASDRDEGWVAASTLAGNRTNTELANVPASIDAITAEFMQDFGVYTLEDTAKWIANVDVVDQHETGAEEQRVAFRGMQLGGLESPQSSRNFFTWLTPTDAYNIDRIDFSKGSNSLMFGDSNPGGMATTYTKRARFGKNSGKVTFGLDSFGSHRVQVDINRKLGDKLALRVNLVDRDDKSYLDFAHSSLRAAHGAISFRPFARTQLRFEAEHGRFERKRASNTLSIRELSAPGLGFSTVNRWFVTSDGEIRLVTTANTSATDRSGAAGDQLSLMEGQAQTVLLMNRVGNANVASGQTVGFQGYNRDINLRGTTDFLDRPYNNWTGYVEQRIGRMDIELAFNHQEQQQERIDGTFGATVSVDRNGRPFVETDLDRKSFGNDSDTFRASLSYPFEIGKWTKQFLVVAAETQRNTLINFRENLSNFAALNGGPGNIANHRVRVRAYLDDPDFPSPAFWEQFRPENLPVTSTFRADWYSTTSAALPFVDIRYAKSQSASLAGTYWGDRIHTLVGVRRDKFDRKRITDLPVDSIGQTVFLGFPDEAPEAYTYDPAFDLTSTTYTAGAVVEVIPGTNLYATRAESFRWQAATDFTGEALGPIEGETLEAGVKTTLFGRKLYANLGVYRTDRSNSRYLWTPNVLTAAEMEDLFNPNSLLPSSPDYFVPAAGLNSEARTFRATERAEGFEATFQLQRMHGFQARLTFSHNKLGVIRDTAQFRALTEAAVARTTAALAPGGNPALAESQSLINDAQAIIAANEGLEIVTGSRSTVNRINWALDYQFPKDGFLKGTRLAVYGNWRDKYVIELIGATAFKDGATHPVGAYIIHQRKLFGRSCNFRLGFRNLLDLENSDDMRIVGVVRTDANGVPTDYNYRYVTPASVEFSTTVDF